MHTTTQNCSQGESRYSEIDSANIQEKAEWQNGSLVICCLLLQSSNFFLVFNAFKEEGESIERKYRAEVTFMHEWYSRGKQCSGSWVKRDQLDVTCFIISLFNAQNVSDVNTSILRSLRLIYWVISWVVLLWFDVCWCFVVWLWWCGIRMQVEALVLQPAYTTLLHLVDRKMP